MSVRISVQAERERYAAGVNFDGSLRCNLCGVDPCVCGLAPGDMWKRMYDEVVDLRAMVDQLRERGGEGGR